jgi:hypothetical protein
MTKNELTDLTYANKTATLAHDMEYFVQVQGGSSDWANEKLVRAIIKAFPGLRRKLLELRKAGYRMSTQERNSVLVKTLSAFFREHRRLQAENIRLQKEIDGIRQIDIF